VRAGLRPDRARGGAAAARRRAGASASGAGGAGGAAGAAAAREAGKPAGEGGTAGALRSADFRSLESELRTHKGAGKLEHAPLPKCGAGSLQCARVLPRHIIRLGEARLAWASLSLAWAWQTLDLGKPNFRVRQGEFGLGKSIFDLGMANSRLGQRGVWLARQTSTWGRRARRGQGEYGLRKPKSSLGQGEYGLGKASMAWARRVWLGQGEHGLGKSKSSLGQVKIFTWARQGACPSMSGGLPSFLEPWPAVTPPPQGSQWPSGTSIARGTCWASSYSIP
jgi:hypothetical protein